MKKAAIIGLGRMGMRHVTVVRQLGLALSAVADVSADSLARAQSEAGMDAVACFSDGLALLDKAVPDVLIVATTAPGHAQLVGEAAARGVKYILCEKPIACSLSDCDAMIDACRRHGVQLAVNHQMRYMEQYTKPKALLWSERYGGLTSINVTAGNFGLAMNGSHYFEMFRYMVDEAPAKVSAWFSPGIVPNPRGAQFEDKAGCVRVETASGKRFYMDCSADQGHGLRVVYGARNGQIMIDELTGRMVTSVRQSEHKDMPTTRYGMPWLDAEEKISPADVIAPTAAVMRDLLENGDYPSAEQGLAALEVLAAAYWSAENQGQTIAVNDPRIKRERVFPWA